MDNQKFTISKQWAFSLMLVVSLTIGSSLMFHLDKLVIKIFNISAVSISDYMINVKEGAILAAIEMGIIPIFAVIAFGLFNKWSFEQILNVGWKVFIVGAVLGVIIGSTYTLNYQSMTCGILH